MTAMKRENTQLQERSTLSGHTQRCSDGSGWEQHPVPKQDDRFGANIVFFFFDEYANTLLGSCNGLRSYQPTSCGCQGSFFLEWIKLFSAGHSSGAFFSLRYTQYANTHESRAHTSDAWPYTHPKISTRWNVRKT